MAPPGIISVVYPSAAKFDMDYYLRVHMPLVQKNWASFGLVDWKVAHYTADDAGFVSVQAWLQFEDVAQWAVAASSVPGKEVFDDVKRFTDATPKVLVGTLTGGQGA
ncbi:uncharacterized protein GGS25DRAFT_239325 [Hypoxylon fragiforme]|uniref:uncharacterized protein n=1 Tax=Hypoxylon fragiforme TaxID=63214 RepID=UPI0020C61AFB|nr:uncharacterized protein GGS25DRAFT_239325 [Hypoxylon fragiforme]KAI2609926.1 hypothetical protein GGS25DRAFT_239325 [Hypoxylon fragiforme]